MESLGTLAGEVLVQSGNWPEVGSFYRGLETRFPKSESLDRYIFFQALAAFQDANFAESSPLLEKFLKQYPNSPLVENALYYVAMSNFLSNKYKETLASCRDYLKKFPDGRYAGDMQYRLSFIDFNDKDDALEVVMKARPHIFNHNLETVERLTPLVRSHSWVQPDRSRPELFSSSTRRSSS